MRKSSILCLMCIIITLMLSACNTINNPSSEITHIHQYKADTTKPSCEEPGYTSYQCACGDSYTTELKATGHSWVFEQTLIQPNYFTEGSQCVFCENCWTLDIIPVECLTIADTGTIVVPERVDLLSILKEPTEEDFGKYYNAACEVYTGLLNNTPSKDVKLITIGSTPEKALQAYETTMRLFEEKCLDNKCTILPYQHLSGEVLGIQADVIMPDIQGTLQLPAVLDAACKDIGLYTGMSQFEAVKAINEWMRAYFEYELEHYKTMDCFKTQKAQCLGYARVFLSICKYVGIEAECVTGCVGHEDGYCDACHAWNRVKLNDTWYYLDVCWNDEGIPNRYFLTEELWPGRIIVNTYTREQGML